MALGGMSTNTLSAMVTNLEPRAARFALALYDLFSLAGPALGPGFTGVSVDTWSCLILRITRPWQCVSRG